MKKFLKFAGVIMAGMVVVSGVSALNVSAATVATPKITVENAKKGIKINWGKTKGAKKYTVLRKVANSKKFFAIKTVNKSGAGSFLDKNVKSGKKYTYKIKAINGKKSAVSKAVKMLRLDAPVISDEIGYEASILWDRIDGTNKYEIFRADVKTTESGEYKLKYKLFDTFLMGEKWEDDEQYYSIEEENIFASFKVRAVKGKFKSAFSNTIKINYVAPPEFGAWLRDDKSAVDVNFTPVKGGAGYKIYRKVQGGKYKLLIDIPASELKKYENKTTFDTHTYVDENYPNDGKVYYYAMESYVNRSSIKMGQQVW